MRVSFRAYDIVRIESMGEAVIAEHLSKSSAIELRIDGRAVAGANADSLSDFAISNKRIVVNSLQEVTPPAWSYI